MFRPYRFRGRTRELLSLPILSLLRKQTNKHSIVGAEKVGIMPAWRTQTKGWQERRAQPININTALPLQARNQMLHGMDWWTFGGADASIASTWFGLRHARLKVVVLQRTVVSSLLCSIFEFWVLCFRDLGASYFGPRCRVLRFQNYL